MNKQIQNNMMNKFAKYYDKIYSDKDYKAESNFIRKVLSQHKISGKKVLDLGCGTGGHAIVLAKAGFTVTGIDISKTALSIAQNKIKTSKIKAEFLHHDMTSFNLDRKFDVCISMFSSLCYLTEFVNLKKTLQNIYRHLKPGGILVFDFWNGNAVINEKPSIKIKTITNGVEKILRIAMPDLKIKDQTCSIKYHCIVTKNTRIVDEFIETHTMRYHFAADLVEHLKNVGFLNIEILPMNNSSDLDNEKFLKNWYLFCVARKPS